MPCFPALPKWPGTAFSLASSEAYELSCTRCSFWRNLVLICPSRYGSYQLSKCQTYPTCFDSWFLWDFMLRCKFVQYCEKTWHTFQYSCVRPKVSQPLVESWKSSPCITTRLPFPNLPSAHIEHKFDTHFHLIFTLSSLESSGFSPPDIRPRPRCGCLGERINDLSAPRLILAITRLLRLSECFLSSASCPVARFGFQEQLTQCKYCHHHTDSTLHD